MKIDEAEFEVNYEDNEVILIRYLGNKTKVEIPFGITIIGSVTKGCWGAFSFCKSLTEVTLPNSVTTIGRLAFYSCSSLTEISLPNSVTSIEEWAFNGCSSLKEITIPNSVTTIGVWAFYDCKSLTEINLPNSLTTIESQAFEGCSSLKEITIPNSVTTIGSFAFNNCKSLADITLPTSVTEIGYGLFRNFPKLSKSIRIVYGEEEILKSLSPDLNVEKSYVFTYVNPNENNVVEEIPISWNVGFKGISIEEVMINFDKSYSNVSAEVKPLIAFFRIRSDIYLSELAKKNYLTNIRAKIDLVVKDLIEREGAKSLYLLVDKGIINTRNVEKIIDRLLKNAEVEMTAILLNIKSKVINDTLKSNKYRL